MRGSRCIIRVKLKRLCANGYPCGSLMEFASGIYAALDRAAQTLIA